MKLISAFAAIAGCAILAAAPASAVTIAFSNITGTWQNGILTDGGPVVTYIGNGTSLASVRWGGDTGFGQSGYDFESIAIPSLTVNPPAGSAATSIALFRHVNQPVFPPSLRSIDLKFSTDVTIDGNPYGPVTFVYSFLHDETTNNSDPCDFGGANGQGVNINGCADRVRTSFNSQSDFITIDGYDYGLDVIGFLVGGNPTTSFLTVEREINEAEVRGRLILYSQAVPEPATWAMMISGFGLVGFAARRRRDKSVVAA